MKTAIFLSVREKATRLPKKVLLDIQGKNVTEHLIDRLKTAKSPDMIVLCTSTHPNDTILVEIAEKSGIESFRGSEDDKLDRYLKAADKYDLDFVVIVDGDDIFCDPEYIDKVIDRYAKTGADYITTDGLPLGAAPFGVKVEALRKVCQLKTESDTEVWGGYFTDTGLFKSDLIKAEKAVRRPDIRLTIDYPEDFMLVNKIFDHLYQPGKIFTLKSLVELLESKPELLEINKKAQEAYELNIVKHTKIAINKEHA